MATTHRKIMIAKVRTYEYEDIEHHIDKLKGLLEDDNLHDIVSEMKHIVPEYISQNSVWQDVDKEIKIENNSQ